MLQETSKDTCGKWDKAAIKIQQTMKMKSAFYRRVDVSLRLCWHELIAEECSGKMRNRKSIRMVRLAQFSQLHTEISD